MSKEEIGSANLKAFKVKLAEKFNLTKEEINLFLSTSSKIMWNEKRFCKSFFGDVKLLEKLCNLGFFIAISPRIYGFQPLGEEIFIKYCSVPDNHLLEVSEIEL